MGPEVDLKIKDTGWATVEARYRKATKLSFLVGIVKSAKYPDRPKVDVATVGAVNEHRYGWNSKTVEEHPDLVDAVAETVAEVIFDPSIKDGRKVVRAAVKALQKAMRETVERLGLVKTGFFRKNIRYKMKGTRALNLNITPKTEEIRS